MTDVRVYLTAPLSYNVTGYDREETLFPAGEQLVPERVADHIARTPSVGRVLEENEAAPVQPTPEDVARLRARIDELEGMLINREERIRVLEAEVTSAPAPDKPRPRRRQASTPSA